MVVAGRGPRLRAADRKLFVDMCHNNGECASQAAAPAEAAAAQASERGRAKKKNKRERWEEGRERERERETKKHVTRLSTKRIADTKPIGAKVIKIIEHGNYQIITPEPYCDRVLLCACVCSCMCACG